MRLIRFGFALLLASALSLTANAEAPAVQPFGLTQVRLTAGPFYQAQQTNLQYLRDLDINRLLAPFEREAGLTPQAAGYGNWEHSGLDGHIGGHYLSALALAVAATGDAGLDARLDTLLQRLGAVQQAYGSGTDAGYLGGIPGSRLLWQQIRAGQINSDLYGLIDRWVPL